MQSNAFAGLRLWAGLWVLWDTLKCEIIIASEMEKQRNLHIGEIILEELKFYIVLTENE